MHKSFNKSWSGLFFGGLAMSILGSAVFVGVACDPPPTLPGTTLGTYSVTGKLASNSCGVSSGAPDPWAFSVQLSRDATNLYWDPMDGTPYISGTLDTTQTKSTITSTAAASPDATDSGPGPCSMSRDTTIAVTLATGTTPATFSGTFTYAFTVLGSSDCADQLASSGGTFQSLPCTIAYTVTATKN